MNVARGGTLHQHLPRIVGHEGHSPAPGIYGSTVVHVVPASKLAEIPPPSLTVYLLTTTRELTSSAATSS